MVSSREAGKTPAGKSSTKESAGLFSKITKIASKAGRPLIEKALYLFYAVQHPKTPAWARRVIYGALAYLVLPTDAIPDVLPAVGFTDDLTVIAAALATVSYYITPEIKQQAQGKLAKWFQNTNEL